MRSGSCSIGKGVYGFLTDSKGRSPSGFAKKSSSRRAYFSVKNLDSPKSYTGNADETTDPTDDAYKKSQHDEEQ
ncbi:hypothetical protein FACS189430_01370 [Bacteroidia bacterium]|nr:hypothetical protein FACS189430_01370 [Bacteroidia bacterium]